MTTVVICRNVLASLAVATLMLAMYGVLNNRPHVSVLSVIGGVTLFGMAMTVECGRLSVASGHDRTLWARTIASAVLCVLWFVGTVVWWAMS